MSDEVTPIDIRILAPAHGAVILPAGAAPRPGAAAVDLRAELRSAGHPPLFTSWFSNLHTPPKAARDKPRDGQPGGIEDARRAQINWDAPQALALPATPLSVGTHVISVSVRELPGVRAADLAAARQLGAAGGPADAPRPCVVHVLVADMLNTPAALPRAGATLEAAAPPLWDKPDYQALNRVGFSWQFTPAGLPGGRGSATHTPPPAKLAFVPPSQAEPDRAPRVSYQGPLPDGLGEGNYTLTLRVFWLDDPSRVHSVSRGVTLT